LRIEGVEAGYGTSSVLFGMSLEAQAGQVISLIGRNGMGKTSTVRAFMGMIRTKRGQITLDGRDIANRPPNVIARQGVGLVPEGRRIFGSLSVEENLVATARSRGGESTWTLSRAYELFPRLRERRGQSAKTLSGGEQQMLAIGRALMINPVVLILDEATEGLAPLIRVEIWNCLQRLKQAGMTILVVDKNLSEMFSLIDRHHIIEKGRVAWSGTPAELRQQPDIALRYLGV